MWDLRGSLLHVLLEQTGIRLAKWNRSGNALLTVGTEESPVVWSESGQVLKEYHAVSASIACIDWANDTEFLIGTVAGDISIYSLNQLFPTVISANELGSVRMLMCRESGDLIAAADEKSVCVWTLAGDIVLQQVMNVSSIAWNPKFTVLTIGCATGRVYSWDASSKNTVDTEGGHQGSVSTLVYRSEGDLFASAAADQHLKVWRLRDGKLLLDLERTAAIKDM
jgi:WD40 repeat protein